MSLLLIRNPSCHSTAAAATAVLLTADAHACQVEVCCFDKTGTLTSDNMILEGVVPPEGGSLQKDISALSAAAVRVLAACQSLISIEGQLVGDPLEKVAYQATGKLLQVQ